MGALINYFTHLGWSRDDAKWTWSQVVSVAALIVSGVFDVNHWATYVGLHPTMTQLHIVQAIAAVILWLSARMDASHLPSADTAKEIKQIVETKQENVDQAVKAKTQEKEDGKKNDNTDLPGKSKE